MSQFCQAGDKARVTFPDGSSQVFTDTPITITCDGGALTEERQRVELCFQRNITTRYLDGSVVVDSNTACSSSYSGYTIYTPVLGSRQRIDGNLTYFEIQAYNTSNPLAPPQWFLFADWVNAAGYQSGSPVITSITPFTGVNAGVDIKKKLIRVEKDGVLLFLNQYENCNYSVECLQPCPLNTLDCGNCCLDCDSIFNGISSIRSLISRIK